MKSKNPRNNYRLILNYGFEKLNELLHYIFKLLKLLSHPMDYKNWKILNEVH
jgi:hypothetical protein